MKNPEDIRVLRDAWADACDEVAFYCERDGRCPGHIVAHAESLQRAIGDTEAPEPARDALMPVFGLRDRAFDSKHRELQVYAV